MRVRTRLGLGATSLLAMMLIVVAVAFLALRDAGTRVSEIAGKDMALAGAASAIQAAQLELAIAVRDFVAQEDVAAEKSARDAMARSEAAYTSAAAKLAQLSQSSHSSDVHRIAEKLNDAREAISRKVVEVVAMVENAEYDRARSTVYKELLPLQRAMIVDLTALANRTSEIARARAESVESETDRALKLIGVLLASALFLGTLGTLWLERGITRPLSRAVTVTERVAAGDLTGEIEHGAKDETGRLLTALDLMQRNLHDVAANIRDGARVVSDASEMIATGNDELSRRTQDQASSLEEVAASVEEIAGTVKQNAESAKSASTLAANAAGQADNGGRIVVRVVETMAAMQDSSKRMADIVGVIDGIAFQTNILALNAAVEAASAGDQGRGFGVVAAEVRALAQRSAGAAKEVKALIGQAVAQAAAGAKLADEAGVAILGIVAAAKEVSGLVANISVASQEQRAGIDQISSAIIQMDGNTQRNTGLVEETNAATQALLDQSRELVRVVGRFKLDGSAVTEFAALPHHGVAQLANSRSF